MSEGSREVAAENQTRVAGLVKVQVTVAGKGIFSKMGSGSEQSAGTQKPPPRPGWCSPAHPGPPAPLPDPSELPAFPSPCALKHECLSLLWEALNSLSHKPPLSGLA